MGTNLRRPSGHDLLLTPIDLTDGTGRTLTIAHGIEKVNFGFGSTDGRQHFKSCQEGGNTDTSCDPDLIVANVTEIEAAIGTFDNHSIATFDT